MHLHKEDSPVPILLQQHLPFTVLKLITSVIAGTKLGGFVATALTVYGIETKYLCYLTPYLILELQQHLPFTVLKPINSRITE